MSTLKQKFEETKNQLTNMISLRRKNAKKSMDKGITKAKYWTKRLLIGLVVIGILSIIGFFLWSNYTYSEGTRAGTLIKISKKGYVFKTYEGQLKLGGIDLKKEDGLSDTWSFSVSEEAIFKKLEKLQGEKVVLRYEEINQAMSWQGDTNYFIIDIESQKE